MAVGIRWLCLSALLSIGALFLSVSPVFAAPWEPGPEAQPPSTINGFIDAPRPGTTVSLGQDISVAGWVVDTTAEGWPGVDKIHVYLGDAGSGLFLAEGRLGVSRPDVALALQNPFFEGAGFEARINSSLLGVGTHLVTVYAHTPDRGWWFRSTTFVVTTPPCRSENIKVEMDRWIIDFAGTAHFNGRVENHCPTTVGVELNIRVHDAASDQPIAATPTVWVASVAASGSASFTSSVGGLSRFGRYFARWGWVWHADDMHCWDVGGSRCLNADGRVGGTIGALLDASDGPSLLRIAADNGVTIIRTRTAPGVLGSYSPSLKQITLDTRLDSYSAWERAAVLAHELQHAADDVAGLLGPGATCFLNEEDAFLREAGVWAELWNYRLPSPQNFLQDQLNDIALTAASDPYLLIARYLSNYGHQCG